MEWTLAEFYAEGGTTRFVDRMAAALGIDASFDEPPQGWARIDDCGEWPCTAPEHIVLKFEDSSYDGGTVVERAPE